MSNNISASWVSRYFASIEAVSYKNLEKALDDSSDFIYFDFKGQAIADPFIDENGRQMFNYEEAVQHYGKENVDTFLSKIATDVMKKETVITGESINIYNAEFKTNTLHVPEPNLSGTGTISISMTMPEHELEILKGRADQVESKPAVEGASKEATVTLLYKIYPMSQAAYYEIPQTVDPYDLDTIDVQIIQTSDDGLKHQTFEKVPFSAKEIQNIKEALDIICQETRGHSLKELAGNIRSGAEKELIRERIQAAPAKPKKSKSRDYDMDR